MKTRIALIRQEQTGGDGGAQAIIDIILEALAAETEIEVSLLCRRWDVDTGNKKIILNPVYHGRTSKQTTFNRAVANYLKTHQFDLVQSHERFAGCDIFRAGDGVHKIWLQQKAQCLNPLARWWLFKDPYHKKLMAEEKRMFESPQLKAVICNSEMVGDEILENFSIAAEKIQIIHNGVDIKRFHPDNKKHSQKTRNALNIPEHCTLFIFPGSGFERKNLKTVIKSLSQLEEQAHLVIVGRDKYQHRYEKLAAQLNIGHRVHFSGAQERSEMPNIYAAADALVLPTLYDPFPNVILEGMATGLPVITSHKCGAATLITRENAGLVVDALNVEELVQAMTSCLTKSNRRQQGQAARKAVENFTTTTMRTKLINLYRSLLAQIS